jgi:hypothetical protein
VDKIPRNGAIKIGEPRINNKIYYLRGRIRTNNYDENVARKGGGGN